MPKLTPLALTAASLAELAPLVSAEITRQIALPWPRVAQQGLEQLIASPMQVTFMPGGIGAVIVRADSPYQTMHDLIKALAQDPAGATIGAGGSVGSQDWMKAALLLREAGAEPQAMRYVAFDGGGEALAGVIGGAIKVYPGDIAEMAFAEAHGSEAHRKVHAEKGLLPLALSGEAFEAAVRQQAEELRTLAEETGIIATTN